jgi:sodium-dependent dicarboxylate transporter 2/3/5
MAAGTVPWAEFPSFARLLGLCLASATLSALMSNTAAATLLIPLAGSIDPAPSTAILIAIAASMGIPFVISTPPNAMVYGEGGVKSTDLLLPGLVLMFLGCLLISLTGPAVLHFLFPR